MIVEYNSAIKRNKIESFMEMWMDLEIIIQSKARQTIILRKAGFTNLIFSLTSLQIKKEKLAIQDKKVHEPFSTSR